MKQLCSSLLLIILLISCSKEQIIRYDWQIVDNAGNNLQIVQNKTEQQLVACLTSGICNTANGGSVTSCNYYKLSDPKYCWNVNGQIYGPYPQKFADCFGRWPNSLRLPGVCTSNPCGKWYTRFKRTYKPTGLFNYSNTTVRIYCNTDTLTLFTNSNPIIIKDDTDSLVLWQRTKTGFDFY